MPGVVVFHRRWLIASDDFVFPGLFELFLRVFWWIGTLVLLTYHKGRFDCSGIEVLHTYLVGLLVVLALIILSLCAIVYVSAQGAILNTDQRRSIPALVYLRAILYLSELVWTCLGTVWLSNNSHGCDPTTVGAVTAGVIASWIILLLTALWVLLVFDPLGDLHQQNRRLRVRNRQSHKFFRFLSKVRSWASKVWEYRLQVLCCCLPNNDRNQAAIASIAEIFSKFFSDTNFVPSDVVAGLSLLQQEQEKQERRRDTKTVTDHRPSSPMKEDLELELENCVHYIKFASAVYGLPRYIYSFLLSRPCHLLDDFCNYDIVGGATLGCQFASLLKTTGLQSKDFICISFHDQVYEVPFFVALDHKREAVVVAVRGTLSFEDALTDLSAECENLPIEGVSGACYAHMGICNVARYIYNKLLNDDDGILYQAFSKVPGYKLVITGHSLGAGAASILALLLRKSYPTLQCYSFCPPGGLLSKALADYSKDFVVSVAVGKDVVPRLSIPNMEDLKKQIFQVVYNCNKPKYRILLQGLWYELFGGDLDDFPTDENRREEALSIYQSLESDSSPEHSAPDVPLFPSGRILHITEDGPSRRSCFSQVRYRADWSNEMSFNTILISPRMIGDHMVDTVMGALNSVTSDNLPPRPRGISL